MSIFYRLMLERRAAAFASESLKLTVIIEVVGQSHLVCSLGLDRQIQAFGSPSLRIWRSGASTEAG